MKREFQHDFEVTMLFPGHGIEVGAGVLAVDKSRRYLAPHVESAYLGYAMARRSDRDRLARFGPTRTVGPGFHTALEAKLGYEVDDETIRAVLAVANEFPA